MSLDGKLLICVANGTGRHSAHAPLPVEEARKIFERSKEYGVPTGAAEFMNEPNMLVPVGVINGCGDRFSSVNKIGVVYYP